MQQRRGVVACEQRAIEVGELAVEEVAGTEQRHHALEVAVRQVAHVEAHQGGADRDAPVQRPALAPHARHGRARREPRGRAAGGADGDVEHH